MDFCQRSSFDVIRYYFSPEIQEIKQEVKTIEEKKKTCIFLVSLITIALLCTLHSDKCLLGCLTQ